MKFKSAAILTIHRASEMSPCGRRDIVKWLRRQIWFLERDYKQLSARYTARFLYKARG